MVWKVFRYSGTFGIFVEFKEFAFELIADISMTKDKKANKCASITETAVCELYHIGFVFKDIVRHVKSNHKDKETVQSLYQIKTFNSIKILAWCLFTGEALFWKTRVFQHSKTPNEL